MSIDVASLVEVCKLPVEVVGAWLLFDIRARLNNHNGRLIRLEDQQQGPSTRPFPKELRL
jgi:hypothetical protein